MKKFKSTIALVLTYVMVMMVLPVGVMKTFAKENLPQYLTTNDLYVNSIAQYKNKALVTYRSEGHAGATILSLVTNGEEKVINTFEQPVDGYSRVSIIDTDRTYVIEKIGNKEEVSKKCYYFDYKSETLVEINENEVVEDTNHRIEWEELNVDNQIKVVEKINEKYNKEYTLYNDETGEGNINVYVRRIVIDGGKAIYEFSAYGWGPNNNDEYYGIFNDEIDLITEGYHNFISKFDYQSGYYLYLEGSGENIVLYLIKDGKIANKCNVDSNFYEHFYNITVNEDNILSRPYKENTIYTFNIQSEELVLVNSIPMTSYLTSIPYDKDGNMWTMFDEDGKSYVAEVKDSKVDYKYEIAKFAEAEWGSSLQMYVYDENNIVVSSANTNETIFIQNETEVAPEDKYLLPEVLVGVIDSDVLTITSGLENGGNEVSLIVNDDIDVQALEDQLNKLQGLNLRSINRKGGASSIVYRFALSVNNQDVFLSISNSNKDAFIALDKFFDNNMEVVPPVVLPPVVPPVVEDIIDEEVVDVVTGNGSEEAPLQLDIKEIETEDLQVFLNDLEKLDAVVSKVEESDEFITYYLKVKGMVAARTFAINSENQEDVYVKLVVSKSNKNYKELVTTLDTFAEANKEVVKPEEPKPEEPKPEEPKPEEPKPEEPKPEDPKPEIPVAPEQPNTGKPEEDKETEDKTETLPQTGAAVGSSAVVLMAMSMIAGGAAISFKRKEKRD